MPVRWDVGHNGVHNIYYGYSPTPGPTVQGQECAVTVLLMVMCTTKTTLKSVNKSRTQSQLQTLS